MGYSQEKIQVKIADTIALYEKYKDDDPEKAREIIVKAYHDYPNDYRIMHCYMWNIGGDLADNDHDILIANKDEFLSICEKTISGCTDESLRLSAWNMRAKLLHAEGKTDEALNIYQSKFADFYATKGQKSEQLFAKDSEEYYYQLRHNMYNLIDFASDKLGRKVFFDRNISAEEKVEKALKYGELILNVYEETGEAFFILLAKSFLGRMQNDLMYRGGNDTDIIKVLDKYLYAVKKFTEAMKEDQTLYDAFVSSHTFLENADLIGWTVNYYLTASEGKRAELLKNPAYAEILNKYK